MPASRLMKNSTSKDMTDRILASGVVRTCGAISCHVNYWFLEPHFMVSVFALGTLPYHFAIYDL